MTYRTRKTKCYRIDVSGRSVVSLTRSRLLDRRHCPPISSLLRTSYLFIKSFTEPADDFVWQGPTSHAASFLAKMLGKTATFETLKLWNFGYCHFPKSGSHIDVLWLRAPAWNTTMVPVYSTVMRQSLPPFALSLRLHSRSRLTFTSLLPCLYLALTLPLLRSYPTPTFHSYITSVCASLSFLPSSFFLY